MGSFKPKDPQFRSRVEASYNQQQVMKALGVTIASHQPGEIELVMPYAAAFFFHCSGVTPNEPDFGMNEEEIARYSCQRSGIPWLGRADIGHRVVALVVTEAP